MSKSVPRKRKKFHRITDDAQAAAMTSPVRMEVLEHLCIVGPTSVRDLAERMGRTPHAVHYHVRQLVRAGLIVESGSRKSGPRDQTLYDIVAERIEVDLEASRGEPDSVEAKALRSILRSAERDFTSLAASDPARLSGDDGITGRARGRLSVQARKDVMKHLRAIERIFAEEMRREHSPRTRLETYNLTVVFLPEARET